MGIFAGFAPGVAPEDVLDREGRMWVHAVREAKREIAAWLTAAPYEWCPFDDSAFEATAGTMSLSEFAARLVVVMECAPIPKAPAETPVGGMRVSLVRVFQVAVVLATATLAAASAGFSVAERVREETERAISRIHVDVADLRREYMVNTYKSQRKMERERLEVLRQIYRLEERVVHMRESRR